MPLVAAIQLASGPQVSANLNEAARLIGNAADSGAELVVLPENFALMPLKDADRLAAVEEEGHGPIQDFLSEQARMHRVWLVGGTIPLAAKNKGDVQDAQVSREPPPGRQTPHTGMSKATKVRAACLLYNDHGERVARYDKIHLFDVSLDNGEQYQESRTIEAGDKPVVATTPWGGLGLTVCYDLRFPELFRELLDQGAEMFALPAAFTAHTGKAHWEVLVRARAIENLSFVFASAQGGSHVNGRETYGNSMIVSPWGEVLQRLERGAGFVIADCDRGQLQSVRTSLPSIQHRRTRS